MIFERDLIEMGINIYEHYYDRSPQWQWQLATGNEPFDGKKVLTKIQHKKKLTESDTKKRHKQQKKNRI